MKNACKISTVIYLLLATSVFAQDIVAYEANSLPEDAGWFFAVPPQPSRYTMFVEDSVLIIDAEADSVASPVYELPISVPDDNMFYEWSTRVSNDDGYTHFGFWLHGYGSPYSSRVSVGSRSGSLFLSMQANTSEPDAYYLNTTITPEEFHTYRIESQGTLYTFYLDGVPLMTQELVPASGLIAELQFGFTKNLPNIHTRGEFDYIRMGIVPEPGTLAFFLIAAPLVRKRRPRDIG